MPNPRQRSVMASPSRSRATKRRRSSTTEHSFQGIGTSRLPLSQAESVTHVSGTICHLCLGALTDKSSVRRESGFRGQLGQVTTDFYVQGRARRNGVNDDPFYQCSEPSS